ncbi:hypothetical protein [Herpetosiphon sp.]|uniref:Uncharacterized protein n=1 Tax=Herpetosiphon aurantiacus (strain ATCC 23779 / DSM 785 / 114-95) TaxID=316274 RepID=A9B2J0_HERA2|nr:hypothetical protein [Herpetosiphon sp.]ABX04035.1 hypothetical protein Haur_1390 [Herpetosiphon aurantiacus DSM 785]
MWLQLRTAESNDLLLEEDKQRLEALKKSYPQHFIRVIEKDYKNIQQVDFESVESFGAFVDRLNNGGDGVSWFTVHQNDHDIVSKIRSLKNKVHIQGNYFIGADDQNEGLLCFAIPS